MGRASSVALAALSVELATGCSRGPLPRFEAGVCWIATTSGAFVPLDHDVANLETCSARLEVVYRRRRQPVTGAYGGVYVYVDASAIDAQAPDGPKVRLIDQTTRAKVDAAIARVIEAEGGP